jgi:hypothetical protein
MKDVFRCVLFTFMVLTFVLGCLGLTVADTSVTYTCDQCKATITDHYVRIQRVDLRVEPPCNWVADDETFCSVDCLRAYLNPNKPEEMELDTGSGVSCAVNHGPEGCPGYPNPRGKK